MTSGLALPENGRQQLMGWKGRARLEKFYADDDINLRDPRNPYGRRIATPYETIEADNLLLTAGATYALGRLTSDSAAKLDATTGRMCVGDGGTAVSASQVDLQGTNKFRKVFDGVPTVSGNTLQAVTTFLTSEANFTWAEAGLANSASGATLVNRFLQAFGTKTGSLQWILTISITLT